MPLTISVDPRNPVITTAAAATTPATVIITADQYVAAFIGAAQANLILDNTSAVPNVGTVEAALARDLAAQRVSTAGAAAVQNYFQAPLCATTISDAVLIATSVVAQLRTSASSTTTPGTVSQVTPHPVPVRPTHTVSGAPIAPVPVRLESPSVMNLGRPLISADEIPQTPPPTGGKVSSNLTPQQIAAAANAANAVVYPFNDKPLEDDVLGNALLSLGVGGLLDGAYAAGLLHGAGALLKGAAAEVMIYLVENNSTLNTLTLGPGAVILEIIAGASSSIASPIGGTTTEAPPPSVGQGSYSNPDPDPAAPNPPAISPTSGPGDGNGDGGPDVSGDGGESSDGGGGGPRLDDGPTFHDR